MDVEFDDDDLERLERDALFDAGLPPGVARSFRMKMNFIRNATDERDLRNWKSLHFEKLKGARDHQHSIRLNKALRLILEFRETGSRKTVVVVAIEDYH